jgi:hypothetical protein
MRTYLISILWAIAVGCSLTAGQDPHEIAAECGAPGRTCEWACGPGMEAESYGGSCTADDGYHCPLSWTIAGTEFRGCCEVATNEVLFHECAKP